MRERAGSAGGTLTAGVAGARFRVRAVLPAGEPAPEAGSGCGVRPSSRRGPVPVAREAHDVAGGRGATVDARAGAAPCLGRLPDLLARLAAAGFAVEQRVRGEPRDLPAGTDLAAYRIAQEALTNAREHGAGAARLTVDHRPDAVEIEVAGLAGSRFRVHAVLPAEAPATAPAGTPAEAPAGTPATAPARTPRPRDEVRPA
jgi:hypothetical protein